MTTFMPRPGAPASSKRDMRTSSPVSSKTSRAAASAGCSVASMNPPGRHQSSTKGLNLRFTRTMPPSSGITAAVTGLGLFQSTKSQLVQASRSRPPITVMPSFIEQNGHVFNELPPYSLLIVTAFELHCTVFNSSPDLATPRPEHSQPIHPAASI